jgi:glutamyl/glutaminyl-tRNA synthetase
MINYVVMLGWTSEEEGREFFTLEELKHLFNINRLNKSAARFDRKKLDWLNGQHIRMLTPENLRDRLLPILAAKGIDTSGKSTEWLTKMAAICQEKIPTLNNIIDYVDFFFNDVDAYDPKAENKYFRQPDSKAWLEADIRMMSTAEDWTHDALKAAFEAEVEATGVKLGSLVNAARLALTGKPVGPGLFELAELMGKETALARMNKALEYVKTLS